MFRDPLTFSKIPSEIYLFFLKSVVKTNSRVCLGIEHVFQQNLKMMEMRTVLMVQMKMEEDLNQLKAVAMNQILSALTGNKKIGGSVLQLWRINHF